MSRSLSRSVTSALALGAALGAAPGCGGDQCGPGSAPAVGVVAASAAATLTYGHLTGSLNNDCNASDAPHGVISMTISGTQTDGTGIITLCVTRPDLLASDPQALGFDVAGVPVRVVDVEGMAAGCSFALDTTQPVTGTASSTGLCNNGSDSAGFALTLDGALSLARTCGTTIDAQSATLTGKVAVVPPP